MSTYQDLLQERERLQQQIEAAKAQELTSVIEEIKQAIQDYCISAADLGLAREAKASKDRKHATIPKKYRDATSGATWSGRGKSPKWIIGKNREAFLIRT